jgi:hypothetical protein
VTYTFEDGSTQIEADWKSLQISDGHVPGLKLPIADLEGYILL